MRPLQIFFDTTRFGSNILSSQDTARRRGSHQTDQSEKITSCGVRSNDRHPPTYITHFVTTSINYALHQIALHFFDFADNYRCTFHLAYCIRPASYAMVSARGRTPLRAISLSFPSLSRTFGTIVPLLHQTVKASCKNCSAASTSSLFWHGLVILWLNHFPPRATLLCLPAILAQAISVQDGIARACSSVALLCCCAISATAVHGSQQEVGFGGQLVRGSLEDDFEGSTSTIRDRGIEQVFSHCSQEEASQSGAKERQRQGSIQGCRPASAEPRGSQAKPQPRRAVEGGSDPRCQAGGSNHGDVATRIPQWQV